MIDFVLKVMILSTLVSIAIKELGPLLPISATTMNALIAVSFPPLLMALLLGWRWQTTRTHDQAIKD